MRNKLWKDRNHTSIHLKALTKWATQLFLLSLQNQTERRKMFTFLKDEITTIIFYLILMDSNFLFNNSHSWFRNETF